MVKKTNNKNLPLRKKVVSTRSSTRIEIPRIVARQDETYRPVRQLNEAVNMKFEQAKGNAATPKLRTKITHAQEDYNVGLQRQRKVTSRGYDHTRSEKKQHKKEDVKRKNRHSTMEQLSSDVSYDVINSIENARKNQALLWDKDKVDQAKNMLNIVNRDFLIIPGYLNMISAYNPYTQSYEIKLVFDDATRLHNYVNAASFTAGAALAPLKFGLSLGAMYAGNKVGDKAVDLGMKWFTPYNSWYDYANKKWGYNKEEALHSNPGGWILGGLGMFLGPKLANTKLFLYRPWIPIREGYYYRTGENLGEYAVRDGVIRGGEVKPDTPFFLKGEIYSTDAKSYWSAPKNKWTGLSWRTSKHDVLVNKGKGNYEWSPVDYEGNIPDKGKIRIVYNEDGSVRSMWNGNTSITKGEVTPLVDGKPGLANPTDFDLYLPIIIKNPLGLRNKLGQVKDLNIGWWKKPLKVEYTPERWSQSSTLSSQDLNLHVLGDEAIKMFKEYGGETIPEGSINGEQLRRYVPEARERYGIVGDTRITDEEIALALYKQVKELGGNTAAVNEQGEPLLLFRGDTKPYTELRERISPEQAVEKTGTMDNSLGTLFLGEMPNSNAGDAGVLKYLNYGSYVYDPSGNIINVVWRPSLTGGASIKIGNKVYTNWFNSPNMSKEPSIVNIPEGSTLVEEHAIPGTEFIEKKYKLPLSTTGAEALDINAFVVKTPNVYDASNQTQTLALWEATDPRYKFQWLTSETPKSFSDENGFPLISYKGVEYPNLVNSPEARPLWADQYRAVLNKAEESNSGLLKSEIRSPFRNEHQGYTYFVLPNSNVMGAKHILPYDLRIPRNWNDKNIYRNIAIPIGIGVGIGASTSE